MAVPRINWLAPDYTPIIQRRGRVWSLISEDTSGELAVAAKLHYQTHGADGCLQFIYDWCWTYDPRRPGIPSWRPFVLFPRQVDYVHWLWERYQTQTDGVTEKSRDSGATYVAMAFSIYLWLFQPGTKIGFGSRKEMLVDRSGDPDSIFEKGRQILARLPKFILPKRFDRDTHCTYMRLINPENGNTITGEAGDNIGRGGRSTMYFKDESAYYEHAERIDAALSENSNCKIDISTPKGSNNPFAKKRFSGKIPVFTFSWRDDPRKDQAWYDRRRDTLPPHVLAQEVDIDYYASVEGIVIPPQWVRAAIDLRLDVEGPRVAGFDVSDGGANKNALVGRIGPTIFAAKQWSSSTTTEAAQFVLSRCALARIDQISYDCVGVGAGIRGEFKRLLSSADSTYRSYSPVVVAFNAGSPPTAGFYAPGKLNRAMFLNLKAQRWWELRDRFYRTWDHRINGKEYDPATLISLPVSARELHVQLSQPVWSCDRPDGKMIIDKTPAGTESPDLAEALMMSFDARRMVAVA